MVILNVTAGTIISPAIAAIAIASVIVKAAEPAVIANIQRVIAAIAIPIILKNAGYRKVTSPEPRLWLTVILVLLRSECGVYPP